MALIQPSLKGTRSHTTPEEAFYCYRGWLKRQGYTQIEGSRMMRPPDGGPIEILTKKSRYGTRLRSGKEGRVMANIRHGGIVVG
jgi:hypothetical protein